MKIRILPNDTGRPPGKLADAELHFPKCAACAADGSDGPQTDGYVNPACTCGPLVGLKLLGFLVWETRGREGDAPRRTVTFPARQYQVNGERRSFALLRPIDGQPNSRASIERLILDAYTAQTFGEEPDPTPADPPRSR